MNGLPSAIDDRHTQASKRQAGSRHNSFLAGKLRCTPAVPIFCPSSPRAPAPPYESVFRILRRPFSPC